ncbi:DUF4244 domain-containing protein [Janibacter anophelis]
MKRSIVRWGHRARWACEAGMTTAEYAVGTLASCRSRTRRSRPGFPGDR